MKPYAKPTWVTRERLAAIAAQTVCVSPLCLDVPEAPEAPAE